ncbi:MAG: MaoC family dehydratase [Bacillota bacterium]
MLLDGFVEGTEYRLQGICITQEDIDEYAPKFDPLPFHIDPEAAKETRFGGIIAPGTLTFMLVWAQWLKMGLYNDCIAGMSCTVNWTHPVYPGDVVQGSIVVEKVLPKSAAQGILVLCVYVSNQNGQAVLNARVTAMMKR